MPNEPEGLTIAYLLREAAAGRASITVTDIVGREVATLDGPGAAGLNRVVWNMRENGGAPSGRGGGRGSGPLAVAGAYRVTVAVAGHTESTVGEIRGRIW